MVLPGGRYTLAAFQEVKGNMRWDPGEPAAYFGDIAPSGLLLKLYDNLDMTVASGGLLPDDFPAQPLEVSMKPLQLGDFGTSVSLETPHWRRDTVKWGG